MAAGKNRFRFTAAATEQTPTGKQGPKEYSKGKQHIPRMQHRPCLSQQLAAQAAELENLNASRVALKARLQATEQQLSIKTVQADTAERAAANCNSQLSHATKLLAAAEEARSDAQNALVQLKAETVTAASHTSALQTRLHDTTVLLGARQQQCAVQQAQMSALQQALDSECQAHAATRERELQATEALQIELQHRTKSAAALAASQKEVKASADEAAVLRCQVDASYKALDKLQKSTAAKAARLEQQLARGHSQLCQQRQTTATALAAARADKFTAARLAAQTQTLQLRLAQSVEQHQAAMAAAASRQQELMAERDAAVLKYQTAQQQNGIVEAQLAATRQELESAGAELCSTQSQLSAALKQLARCQLQTACITSSLQTKLGMAAARAQLQSEVAARAMATSGAAKFAAARLQAQQNSLQQRLMAVTGERDQATAAAAEMVSRVQQAMEDKAMLEQALAAWLDENAALQAALSETTQQLANSRSDGAQHQQQVSTAQRALAAVQHSSATNTAQLQHQLSMAQSNQLQQRDTAARYGASAAAATFRYARLQAESATIKAQLTDALQQQAAASASSASTIVTLLQAQQQAAIQQEAVRQQLLVVQQQHSSTQQELRVSQASLTSCTQQLAATSQALLKLQQASAATTADLQAQLRQTINHKQQKREAAARFAADARACKFVAAREAAARRTLQEQLATAQRQHAASSATAAATITSLQHAAVDAAAETYAAQQQLHTTCAALASTQQQLADAEQDIMALQEELTKHQQTVWSKGNKGPSTAALQRQLRACQVRMQQQREAAARAHARAQAAEWRAAKQQQLTSTSCSSSSTGQQWLWRPQGLPLAALAAACRSCISSQHSGPQRGQCRQLTKRGPCCLAASTRVSAAAAGVSTHSTCQTAAATWLSQLPTALIPVSSTRWQQQQQQQCTPMTVTCQAPAPAAGASCTAIPRAVLPRVQAALHQAPISLTAAPVPGCLSSAGGGAVGSGMATCHDAATLAAPAAVCSVVPERRRVMHGNVSVAGGGTICC